MEQGGAAGRLPGAHDPRPAAGAVARPGGQGRGLRGHVLPSRRAPVARPARRRHGALPLSRPAVRPRRQVHRSAVAGHRPGQCLRAHLPGGRAPSLDLDLDGRCGQGRPRPHPRHALARGSGLAQPRRLHALRHELPADLRQPARSRAPALRPSHDARRLGGLCAQPGHRRDAGARPQGDALGAQHGAAALRPEGAALRRPGRPLEHL